jgi:hypothetical protein
MLTGCKRTVAVLVDVSAAGIVTAGASRPARFADPLPPACQDERAGEEPIMQRGIEVRVVVSHDDVGSRTKASAREKVAHVARLAPGPVLLARVRLARAADPG